MQVTVQGELITTEGRAAVASDPMGEKFPWLPEGAVAATEVAEVAEAAAAQ